MTLVVVGLDHSAGAKAALRFALEEARMMDVRLKCPDEPAAAAGGRILIDRFWARGIARGRALAEILRRGRRT